MTTIDLGKVKGDSAGFGTPIASVDDNVGTPSVSVTASGPDTAKVFSFNFKNLKGESVAYTANGLNPTLDNSTHAPFITFEGNGKTTQNIEKYLTKLSKVSDGVQTNIIDCKPGEEVVLDCGTKRSIGCYVYFEDNTSMYEEGSAYVQAYTFTPGGKMQFIIKGGTIDDNIRITVNGSEYRNPSPDNPVEILGVGESGSLEVVSCGKNVLPLTVGTISKSGIDFTVDKANGVITLNGTATVDTFLDITTSDISGKFLVLNTEYISDFGEEVAANGNVVMAVGYRKTGDSTNKYSVYSASSKEVKFTLTEECEYLFARVRVASGTTLSNMKIYPMIRLASETDGTYEPYTETKANIPLSAPLYEGDYILYNMDGSGELVRKMKEVDMGSLNWKYDATYERFSTSISDKSMNYGTRKDPNLRCDRYTTIADGRSFESVPNYSVYNSDALIMNVCVIDHTYTNVTDFKNAVQGSKLVYKLAEPTVTPLTAEQVAEFEKLQTFDGVTHVTCEAESEIDYFRNSVSGRTVAMVAKMIR